MFVSILEGPPYELEIVATADEPGSMIAVPLARDDDTSRVVFVQTLLQDAVIDDLDHGELVFQIAIVCEDGTQEDHVTQMRDVARQYLPNDCIPKVMEIVKESVILLATTCNPALIYYVTKESHLPEKALSKYDILTEALKDCGYVIYELGTDSADRAFWKLMAPKAPEPEPPSH